MSTDLLGGVLGAAAAAEAAVGEAPAVRVGASGAPPASPARPSRGIGRHKSADPDDVVLEVEMGAGGGGKDGEPRRVRAPARYEIARRARAAPCAPRCARRGVGLARGVCMRCSSGLRAFTSALGHPKARG